MSEDDVTDGINAIMRAERIRDAAPDMLAALKVALVQFDRLLNEDYPDSDHMEAFDVVRAAIAKAEGKP